MNKIPFYLTIFLLFFLPFVIFPIGSSQFEVPKVIVAQIVIELLVLFRLLRHEKPNIPYPVLVGFLVLFSISVLDLIFFRTPLSFFGNSFRLQGIFLFWHLLLFSIFADKNVLQHIGAKALICLLLVQLSGDFLFGVNVAGRSFGFLGEPNSLAAVALVVFPLLFVQKNSKKLVFFCYLLLTVLLIISGSRSGVMGFIIQAFFLLFSYRFPARLTQITVASFLLVLATLLTPFFLSNIHESRVEIWYAAVRSFLSHPVIGGGFGNIDLLLHEQSLLFASFISARYVDSSHNILLDMVVQSGIVGAGAFFLLLFSAFRFFCQKKYIVHTALLIGLLTVLFFNPVSVWVLLFFWYLLGQGISVQNTKEIPS